MERRGYSERGREACARCGTAIGPGDGFRLHEAPGARFAAFCRLEHIVPWAIQGPSWEPGDSLEPALKGGGGHACAQCDEPLGEVHLTLVRHRGEHRIPDRFCHLDHLLAWAKAGGRWR